MAGFAAALPYIIPGLSGLAGLFGGKSQKTTQTMTPNLTPQQQQMLNMMFGGAQNQFQQADLSKTGYEASGISRINQNSDLRSKIINNMLAAKGLSGSPAGAATLAGIQAGRIGDITNFQNQIPLQEWQMRNEALKNMAGVFGESPKGYTSTSTGPSNQMAGLFSGLGSGLGAVFGQKWGWNQAARGNRNLGGYTSYGYDPYTGE